MIKPLPILLCVVIVAAIAGCDSRNDQDGNDGPNGKDKRAAEAPKPGAPHALATPVAALGVRG